MATPNKDKEIPQFVSVKQFDELTEIMKTLASEIKDLKNKPTTPEEIKKVEEVEKAVPDKVYFDPAWEEKAREIIGESMDYCKVTYPKGGGQIFSVVIKPEFSNAPQDYIERYKVDMRSKEIGDKGIAGVEEWCKLIKGNLARKR